MCYTFTLFLGGPLGLESSYRSRIKLGVVGLVLRGLNIILHINHLME
jgi:hypothetical protein